MVGFHRAQLVFQAGFQQVLKLAVILFGFALLQQVLGFQLGAARLGLALTLPGGRFQRRYPGGELGFLAAKRRLQGRKPPLVLRLQVRAQGVIFFLGFGQAAGVLALRLEQARIPALYDGALVVVQLFEFFLVLVLQAFAQTVQLGFFFQQLLYVQLAFPQQRHRGFELGVKILFFLQRFAAGLHGFPQGGLFRGQAAGGLFRKGEVFFEVGFFLLDSVQPFQRPAQGHAGGVEARHIVHHLLYFAVFVCHN